MAPKKRKGRRTARRRGPQTAPRHDSCSDDGGSDDFPSAMPRLEGAGQDTEERCDDNGAEPIDDEDDFEVASLYPASQLAGGARSTYRSGGGHFVTGDPRAMASDLASTRSLWTMDLDYRELHGRRYCRDYYMPNDELEQLRVTLLHQVFVHILDGELTLVPLEEPPSHVLDVGTGTGEWAIRMAEMFPECEVVGTDISAIAETESVPVNVFFEIEDAEDWDRPPDHYDMIHMRWLAGSFRDWRFVYDCAYYSLKPGGWIEVLDFDGFDGMACIDHFPPESPIHRLFKDIHKAAELSGRKLSMDHLNAPDFMDAGFVDIRVMEYSLPLVFGEPSIDKLWLMALIDGIESSALRLLTEHMGWDPDECKAVCEQVARDLANLTKYPKTAKDLVIKLRVVVARKPLEAPMSNEPWPAEEPLHMRTRREGGTPRSESASAKAPSIAHTDEIDPRATENITLNGTHDVS
ncbi:S-adenosyl-L-methionine-dependent methyltransferase [Trichoderma gracile]